MQITSIRIKKTNKNNDRILGVASIEFDNCLVIHGIKLVQLKHKRIVSFPSKKLSRYEYNSDGNVIQNVEFSDIVHPSNKEFRQYVENELFKILDSEEEK